MYMKTVKIIEQIPELFDLFNWIPLFIEHKNKYSDISIIQQTNQAS